MLLNCDLGEGLDSVDAQVMPHLDMANIACGGHAGDNRSMTRCVALAQNYGVAIGAHPSYPDRANMGRKSLAMDIASLEETLQEQIATLKELCEELGTELRYIKPHGALYNDMVSDPERFSAVVSVCAKSFRGLPLVVQALCDTSWQKAIAANYQQTLWYEGFADRAYRDDGRLVSRDQPNALHSDVAQMVAQAQSLIQKGGLYTETQQWLPLRVDTLCVHGDTPTAVAALLAIRDQINRSFNSPNGH